MCFVFLLVCIGLISLLYLRCLKNNVVFGADVSEIENGELYEVTENSFQEGLEYTFSVEEIDDLKEILETGGMEGRKKKIKQTEIKYLANFYNSAGEEIFALAFDKKARIYSEDGYWLKDEAIESFFEKIIGVSQP